MRLLAALAVALAAGPAWGQPVCLPVQDMRDRLALCCGEYPAWWGVDDRSMLELLISPTGMTWSIIRIRPGVRGALPQACLEEDGPGWGRPYPPQWGTAG